MQYDFLNDERVEGFVIFHFVPHVIESERELINIAVFELEPRPLCIRHRVEVAQLNFCICAVFALFNRQYPADRVGEIMLPYERDFAVCGRSRAPVVNGLGEASFDKNIARAVLVTEISELHEDDMLVLVRNVRFCHGELFAASVAHCRSARFYLLR